ncbi:hypothetical protein DSCA_54140 [Desulfosarcina alkanivorans]|jgi:hypothetical protein|uniref:Uncharacterized protein n=1 Tax=Desulfosarcina alkanivorans TaxID=571177 RepID=A0A5K7YYS4_9BACT|nr:hypothetical protein DSCA_54140 [Desulfosarcina alkanivorans]
MPTVLGSQTPRCGPILQAGAETHNLSVTHKEEYKWTEKNKEEGFHAADF